jgi:hypothetical protein
MSAARGAPSTLGVVFMGFVHRHRGLIRALTIGVVLTATASFAGCATENTDAATSSRDRRRSRLPRPPRRSPRLKRVRWRRGADRHTTALEAAACTAHQQTLYGAWTTTDAVAAAKARVPILMYHQFTAKPEGESGWLRGNYSYIEDYRAQMQYIKDQSFYLPTWDELSAFIDGALYLPDHAVIITDDDADPSWLTMASPINEQLQLMATSFVITGSGVPHRTASSCSGPTRTTCITREPTARARW